MVEDRGYQFSDGVYEVFAIRNGALLDEGAHLDRLDYSLDALRIAAPMSRGALQIVMREVVRRNRVRNGILYVQVSRGVAPREHSYGADVQPVLTVTARATDPSRRQHIRAHGIEVISVPDQRWARCDIKSISLLPNVLARQAARDAKVQEAWQIDESGLVTEGGATNAWIVDAKGRLRTRPADHDILNGIIRQVLIKLAPQLDIELCEEAFSLDEAIAAKECFSTASTMAVFPVVSIDGRKIGNGKPGPVALALADAYDRLEG
jgi:D-alanine transaminase